MTEPEWQAAYNAGTGDARALREALEEIVNAETVPKGALELLWCRYVARTALEKYKNNR